MTGWDFLLKQIKTWTGARPALKSAAFSKAIAIPRSSVIAQLGEAGEEI